MRPQLTDNKNTSSNVEEAHVTKAHTHVCVTIFGKCYRL